MRAANADIDHDKASYKQDLNDKAFLSISRHMQQLVKAQLNQRLCISGRLSLFRIGLI